MNQLRVLLIGYGNPGRQDDGLGPALADRIEKMSIPSLTVDADYQLTVEDASTVADHDVAIFADAAVQGAAPFFFRPVMPCGAPSHSTHHVEPEEIVALARQLFGWYKEAYVLGIRGYEFNEFGERLSVQAQANLEAAAAFVEETVRTGAFAAAAVSLN